MNYSDILEFTDPNDLYHAAARFFVESATNAIAKYGCFTAAISGGNGPQPLFALLAGEFKTLIQWERGYFFWVDERDVPEESEWSNYGNAKRLLLDRVPLPPANIHCIPTCSSLGTEQYRQLLREHPHLRRNDAGIPQFDIMQLGLGPDGHIASLFPDSATLQENTELFIATPPPSTVEPAVARLTLTLPVINAAVNLFFLIASRERLNLVNYILDQRNPVKYPAQMVQPEHAAHWFILR
jgi:6-phosphogluconolactonase